jgi:hypothetical protein
MFASMQSYITEFIWPKPKPYEPDLDYVVFIRDQGRPYVESKTPMGQFLTECSIPSTDKERVFTRGSKYRSYRQIKKSLPESVQKELAQLVPLAYQNLWIEIVNMKNPSGCH